MYQIFHFFACFIVIGLFHFFQKMTNSTKGEEIEEDVQVTKIQSSNK